MTMDDHDFDLKARKLYLDAARETPQAVQQRLRVALARPRPSRQAWQPMVAFASVAALAIGGLLLQRPLAPATGIPEAVPAVAEPVAAPTVAATAPQDKPAIPGLTTAYDNDPEFYAWLGNDAPPVPGE